jgi:hypothetical protein
MDNELCKCGKVGKISCPNDERCNNTQLNDEFLDGIKKAADALHAKIDTIQAKCDRYENILKEAYEEHLKEKELLIIRYPTLFPGIENYIKPWVNKAREALSAGEEKKKEPDDNYDVEQAFGFMNE